MFRHFQDTRVLIGNIPHIESHLLWGAPSFQAPLCFKLSFAGSEAPLHLLSYLKRHTFKCTRVDNLKLLNQLLDFDVA